jgi:hypothetical protein
MMSSLRTGFAVLAVAACMSGARESASGDSPQRATLTHALAARAAAVNAPFANAQPSFERRFAGRTVQLVRFPTAVQHIVVIYMENRTVDDLFGAFYSDAYPTGGTWGQALDLYNPNAQPTLAPNPLGAYFDPDHSHIPGFVTDAAGNWSSARRGCSETCPPNASVYSYVPKPETNPYAAFVTNFAFADHVLQANEGPSYPAHQYAIAGQSGGIAEPAPPMYAPYAQAENPGVAGALFAPARSDALDHAPVGNCFGPTNFIERTVNMTKPYPGVELADEDHPPCAEYPTIFDSVAQKYGGPADLDWQFIASLEDGIWAAPMAVNHLYSAYKSDPNPAVEPFAVDPDALNFVRNVTAANGNPVRPFAALTFITPCINESDHPLTAGAANGPQWLAYVLNAIGESQYWPNTTVIVTWDDWGGFFDHFRPGGQPKKPFHPYPNPYGNIADTNEWGFRVPLIVISPYVTSRGYVSRRVRSQGAILNYIEQSFGLPSLGSDDRTNGSDHLGDLFDFSHAPLPYMPVPTTFDPSRVPTTCRFG